MSQHILSELENTTFLPLEKILCGEKNLGNTKFINVIAASKDNTPPPPLPP